MAARRSRSSAGVTPPTPSAHCFNPAPRSICYRYHGRAGTWRDESAENAERRQRAGRSEAGAFQSGDDAGGRGTGRRVGDDGFARAETRRRRLPETRDRVLEIVKQTGYVPDATARVFAPVAPASSRRSSPRSTTRISPTRCAACARCSTCGPPDAARRHRNIRCEREEDLIGAFLQRRPEAVV